MTDVLKHRFVSAKANGADATQIQPSHWNDGHNFIGGNQGEFLTRNTADASFGAKWTPAGIWLPYAPVWSTTSGAQPTGHQLAGLYTTIGKTCHFEVRLILPGGVTVGTAGIYQLTVPIVSAWVDQEALGAAVLQVGFYYTGTVLNNGTTVCIVALHEGGNFWGPGSPVTMAPGSTMKIQGTYEIGVPLAEELAT